MSVWPALARDTSLSGREGQLVCISIDVDARSLESLWYALTRWTVAWRSRASRTAQRTAASEAADPSTPTTMRLPAGECVMAHLPRDETVPVASSLTAAS